MKMGMERVLEVEYMDTLEEARDYDSMDHSAVNRRFVEDLLAVIPEPTQVLDLGTGTARIPIELCRRVEDCRVLAVDAAATMLDIARLNIEIASLTERVQLDRVDAKRLPYSAGFFAAVMSNSILHHIPEPLEVLREAVRVTAPGGQLFFRDLVRPTSAGQLQQLVACYAGQENEHSRAMFADSLHAALTCEEVQEMVAQLGFDRATVALTSDRHWTWSARKSG
jgi:ubiquinone/menaquinone biosynthesis C-methylase UbiE